MNEIVEIGDRIQLRQILYGKHLDDKIYKSQLVDMKNDKTMKIVMPFYENRLIFLENGTRYEVVIYNNKGLFSCIGQVVSRSKVDTIYLVELSLVTKLKKNQRREFYRLECLIDLNYCIINHEVYDATKTKEITYFADLCSKKVKEKAIIIDISGGGIRFAASYLLGEKTYVYLEFNLGSIPIKVLGEVIYSSFMKHRDDIYEIRVKFVDITSDVRERIIRYIFEEERKIRQLKKGNK